MRRFALLTLALGLATAGCGGGDAVPATTEGSPSGDSVGTITIEGFDFGAPVTLAVGDSVTVNNRDGAPHTWTAGDGSFDSGTIAAGGSFEFTFENPGEYQFFCAIHPSMTGSITVTG